MENFGESSTKNIRKALFSDNDYFRRTGLEEQRRPKKPKTNGHLQALNQLDFKKQFLILSYCGKKKLHDVISVDTIKSMQHMQMSFFEPQLWRLLGRHCIQERDRAKNIDWGSEKPFMYHCHVDPDGNYTFKGPYLQAGQTHLQRVLGDENVLVVKFSGQMVEGAGRNSLIRCNSTTSPHQPNRNEGVGIYNSNSAYHQIREEGILVGLRRYCFFVFKDGGKEEKNKEKDSPTSSSVKCYFVCIDCVDSDDPLTIAPSILLCKSVSEARSLFMHVHNVSSIAKYMARFSLILSKTIKLDIDFASVRVEEIEDIACRDQDGCIVYNEDGEPRIHTDGTGFISQDLALKCPRNIFKGKCSSQGDFEKMLLHQIAEEKSLGLEKSIRSYVGDPPLLIQFRMFHNGSAVKGTALVNKKLPRGTIQVRPSMIKVRSDLGYVNDEPMTNSFEVVATSMKPKRTNLSKYLHFLATGESQMDTFWNFSLMPWKIPKNFTMTSVQH